MKLFDVTAVFSEDLPVYNGDPSISIVPLCSMDAGASCNVSTLRFGSHSGTHVDAPKHFINTGMTLDEMPLEHFMGHAQVFDLSDVAVSAIKLEHLQNLDIKKGGIVLFKTRNSTEKLMQSSTFTKEYVYISLEAARYLTECGIRTVGIDYLSVEQFNAPGAPTHTMLLGGNIAIIEGLVLIDVPGGEYELTALPIPIRGGNGCPIRAVLRSYD